MSKPLIIANWKCNPSSLAQAKALFNKINSASLKYKQKFNIIICPPLAFMPFLIGKRKNVEIGSQNVFWQEGAFTGEVSAKMLKSIGCKYVIVGHSERRARGESEEDINKKIKAVLSQEMTPIFCIGETFFQKKEQKTAEILQAQIENGLTGIVKNNINKIIIAYEPVWAVGTGNPCKADDTMTMIILIKKFLSKKHGWPTAKKIRIIYGGSADASNARNYVHESGAEGLLIAGASLSAKKFIDILRVL